MGDNDLREDEEKSLLDDMAKKGISKKIKTIPLGTKIISFLILGIVIFLLIFIVLVSSLTIMLFKDEDESASDSNITYIDINSEDNFWWPIGGVGIERKDGKEYATGSPTSTYITSYYDLNRVIVQNGISYKSPHKAIDIGSSGGTDYIISVARGTVTQVNNTCSNNGAFQVEGVSNCGGSYGNYLVIEHSGGISTRYAHLYPGSIPVSVGDVVEQGQVIGIMGNSGNSTGTHLHFEVITGSDGRTNPLDYVSNTNTRPITVESSNNSHSSKSEMLAMLQSWEGTGKISGDSYVVYDDGSGVLTVGHGVTLKNHKSKFEARGINASSLGVGSKVKISIVDDIELEILNGMKNSVNKMLSNNNITLKDYQVEALVIRMYNTGNVGGFPEKYKLYGNTDDLYTNYMSTPVTGGGKYYEGLAKRRNAEWNLFHNGIYTYNN